MVVKVVDVVDIKVVAALIVAGCVGVLLLLASRMTLANNSLVV